MVITIFGIYLFSVKVNKSLLKCILREEYLKRQMLKNGGTLLGLYCSLEKIKNK